MIKNYNKIESQMLEIIVLSILFGLLQSSEQNKYLNNDMITPCIDTKNASYVNIYAKS